MDWKQIDWVALERLRRAFLAGSAGATDYWQDEGDLRNYDQTFAQRIGWKWDHVLRELTRRGWMPPPGAILDWGCGSGIAGRAFAGQFGTRAHAPLLLWDRSPLAMRYAARRAQERFPELTVELLNTESPRPEVLLLSHVLTELGPEQLSPLLELAKTATAVLWVEPGTHSASRRLGEFRQQLRRDFQVVAPCMHAAECPMFLAQNASHWCHHFATPPPEVFTDGNWAKFGLLAGVDLRSLPLSFLVLDKRAVPPQPAGSVRLIGRPRTYKGHALLLGCSAEGLTERRLSKRRLPEAFRQAKKDTLETAKTWVCEGDEIVSLTDQP
jgi:ribosomal protein RSM22 (predicted rRNA methylase)